MSFNFLAGTSILDRLRFLPAVARDFAFDLLHHPYLTNSVSLVFHYCLIICFLLTEIPALVVWDSTLKHHLGNIKRLHQAMASVGSGYSGSPDSKSTIDTPENGPYDNFFSLITPSDLRLSLSDDSYAEWKALPSRLLESPPPQLSTIQFRNHPGKLAGGSKPMDDHDLFDVDESLRNHHPSGVDLTPGNLGQGTECSSPPVAIGRHNPECSNSDRKSPHSSHGLNDQSSTSSCILQDLNNPETTEWSTTSTRHLKICNIAPTTSLVILYELLQVGPLP